MICGLNLQSLLGDLAQSYGINKPSWPVLIDQLGLVLSIL
jgi:hypothetical protein